MIIIRSYESLTFFFFVNVKSYSYYHIHTYDRKMIIHLVSDESLELLSIKNTLEH